MTDFTLLYWHWLLFGMALIIVELFFPNFTTLWFGLGALLVAVLLILAPGLHMSWQLFVWALVSVVLTILWFKYFKHLMPDRTKAGVAREAILGESGQVIKAPHDHRKGTVRFSTPVLGADEWHFVCDQPVEVGDRVFIKDITGNTLIVEKRS